MAPRKGNSAKVVDRMAEHQPELSTEEWAYIAGIIDGEGTISVIRVAKRNHYALRPQVQITNTHEPLFRWLVDKLGIGIVKRNRDDTRDWFKQTPKTSYVMTVPGYRCYSILQYIEPFLIIKKEHAQIVMQFIESRAQQPYNGPYTQNEIDLWLRVRALNHGGFRAYDAEVDLIRSFTTSQPPPEVS